jgi:hypothetical protein
MMDRVDTMKVLIRLGANVNEPNNTGSTPLHAASLNGYGPSMELLVEKGAQIDAKNIYSYSPVNYADSNSRGHSPIYNHVHTVEYVLAKKKEPFQRFRFPTSIFDYESISNILLFVVFLLLNCCVTVTKTIKSSL